MPDLTRSGRACFKKKERLGGMFAEGFRISKAFIKKNLVDKHDY